MAPQATHITTVDEIDEALWWVVLSCPRDAHYERIVDALLDQRNRVTQADPTAPAQRPHSPSPAAPPQGSPHPSTDCQDSASSR